MTASWDFEPAARDAGRKHRSAGCDGVYANLGCSEDCGEPDLPPLDRWGVARCPSCGAEHKARMHAARCCATAREQR